MEFTTVADKRAFCVLLADAEAGSLVDNSGTADSVVNILSVEIVEPVICACASVVVSLFKVNNDGAEVDSVVIEALSRDGNAICVEEIIDCKSVEVGSVVGSAVVVGGIEQF